MICSCHYSNVLSALPLLHCPPKLTGNRGFTLIEALVTASIVACGLVAVAAIFSFAIRTNIANRQNAVAVSLLYDKMEELKSTSITADGSDEVVRDEGYVRVWRISSTVPRTVTVIVYAHQTELIRATTLTSPAF